MTRLPGGNGNGDGDGDNDVVVVVHRREPADPAQPSAAGDEHRCRNHDDDDDGCH